MKDFQQPSLTFEDAMLLLQTGTIEEALGFLPWGSNYTILVTVENDGTQALAVYKPQRGERPLWDFPDGSLCKREVVACIISETLNWRIVPATILRDGPQGLGSIQYFIPHNPDEHYFTFGSKYRKRIMQIAVFDAVINNADRKGGHCILDASEHIWGIDHGLAFHTHPKLRTVIWEYADKAIPDDLLQDLDKLCERLSSSRLHGNLRKYLSSSEINALQARIDNLLTRKRFPEPGSGRSYPWPPV